MNHKKVYVEVTASFRPDGVILPREIVWEDGRHYDIDRVSAICQSASMKVGGQGDRYTIIVNGKPKYLFFRAQHKPHRKQHRAMVCGGSGAVSIVEAIVKMYKGGLR